ncbi:MAG: hypothetical protein ACLVK5_00375 [Peptoniphilus senegalensis]
MKFRVKKSKCLDLKKGLDTSKLIYVEVPVNTKHGQHRAHRWKSPNNAVNILKLDIAKQTNIKEENIGFINIHKEPIDIEKITRNYTNLYENKKEKPTLQAYVARKYTVIDITKEYGDKEFNKQVKQVGEKLIKKAHNIEKPITNTLLETSKELGAKMEGLEFKFKGLESLVRKIKGRTRDGKKSLEEASYDMKDVLRYTMILDENNFVDGFEKTRENLSKLGYNIYRVKNTFHDGAPYKGLNTNVKDSQGNIFELQFHTQKSFDIKMGPLHKMYEEQRELDLSYPEEVERWNYLKKKMVTMSLEIPNPKSVGDIKSI